jgi:hypothetical protein
MRKSDDHDTDTNGREPDKKHTEVQLLYVPPALRNGPGGESGVPKMWGDEDIAQMHSGPGGRVPLRSDGKRGNKILPGM